VTAPPQHWPSDGPSANDCSLRAATPPLASTARAAVIAFSSRWPPPIVPSDSSTPTSMRVPTPRGTEPRTAVTSTTTAGRASASQAAARSRRRSSLMAAPPAPR
jgi:hypothetical protein